MSKKKYLNLICLKLVYTYKSSVVLFHITVNKQDNMWRLLKMFKIKGSKDKHKTGAGKKQRGVHYLFFPFLVYSYISHATGILSLYIGIVITVLQNGAFNVTHI